MLFRSRNAPCSAAALRLLCGLGSRTIRQAVKEEPKAVQQKLVSLSPAEKPVLSSAELTHLVQVELRRVGCLTDSIGNEWTPAVRKSLEMFNKYSGMELNTKLASLDALDAIKTKEARICPLTCSHGYEPHNESCVKIVTGKRPPPRGRARGLRYSLA